MMRCLTGGCQVASDSDHEYGEMEEDDDQEKFSYQLLVISSLAQLVANYSLPLLTKCIVYFCFVLIVTAMMSRSELLAWTAIDCLLYTLDQLRNSFEKSPGGWFGPPSHHLCKMFK